MCIYSLDILELVGCYIIFMKCLVFCGSFGLLVANFVGCIYCFRVEYLVSAVFWCNELLLWDLCFAFYDWLLRVFILFYLWYVVGWVVCFSFWVFYGCFWGLGFVTL